MTNNTVSQVEGSRRAKRKNGLTDIFDRMLEELDQEEDFTEAKKPYTPKSTQESNGVIYGQTTTVDSDYLEDFLSLTQGEGLFESPNHHEDLPDIGLHEPLTKQKPGVINRIAKYLK